MQRAPFIAAIYLLFLAVVVSAQQHQVTPRPHYNRHHFRLNRRPNGTAPANNYAVHSRGHHGHRPRLPLNGTPKPNGGQAINNNTAVAYPFRPPNLTGAANGTSIDEELDPHPGRLFGFDISRAAAACPQCDKENLLKQEFMASHNWVRNEYKLPLLTWDEKLASFARGYAMKRYDDCKTIHSDASYGENIFWGKRLNWTASDAVYHWYRERRWYDFNTLKCTPPSDPLEKSCGHFTQLVWRDSARVGCALQHCRNNNQGMLIICEYDPPGNFDNENPLDENNAKQL